ncbi:hypothetical protein COJ27_29440 [Bacillus cereus]|uniref:DUF4411 family protein n=1 Tax=Bacillus cereus TaxID=1396 RepID=UPI000BF9D78D|nr:DUF4411 family protein [Bacillus cereus]PFL57725.1 hypothetical protein COJ27_29440 [Bacillus cereus]
MGQDSLQDFSSLLLDTNVFRYQTTPGSPHKDVANRFWETVTEKLEQKKIELCTADEVVRELGVQSFSSNPKEVKEIRETLLPKTEVNDYLYDAEAENLVRQASALLSANYKLQLPSGKFMVKYPDVGDARILLTAYESDSIIVTSNVKDFMLYPLLYPQNGKVLYDLLLEKYVQIDPILYMNIQNNARFADFKSKIEKYKFAC